MRARRIAELEYTLENERIGIQRQNLLKQIWQLRSRPEQESATTDGLDEQPMSSLSTRRKESPRVVVEQSPASTAV
jgi:hypothetical protein